MMKPLLCVVATLCLSTIVRAAPTTEPGLTADLTGTSVVPLFEEGDARLQPTTQPELITEKTDKNGRRDRSIKQISRPAMTVFLPSATTRPIPAVIVIPGGGYAGEVFDREGYFVAERLRAAGVAAFVLKYRLPNSTAPAEGELPLPVVDVLRAVRMVRSSAGKWNVDPQRVGVMGFSAGGHVAGAAATEFADVQPDAADPIDSVSSRPDFAVLMYAVSSMHESIAHAGSRTRLLGSSPTPALEDRFSTAQRITKATPPLFMVHAEDDRVVKVENSVEVAAAAAKSGVPCRLMLLKSGGHGFALGQPNTEAAGWFDHFLVWLNGPPVNDQK